MSRFGFNPADVDSGIPIFPKDRYEFIIGEPKAFQSKPVDGREINHGVRFALVVAEGTKKGKRTFFTCYQHTEGARSFSKGFQMASLGYKLRDLDEETRFNTEHGNDDWSYDPDDASCGEGWHGMKGQRINANLDVDISPDGRQQQKWIELSPLS